MFYEQREQILLEYDISELEFNDIVGCEIAESFGFYKVGVLRNNYVDGFAMKDNVLRLKSFKLTEKHRKKLTKSVYEKLDIRLRRKHYEYAKAIFEQAGGVIEGKITSIQDSITTVELKNNRLLGYAGRLELTSFYTLKKDIIKKKYQVGETMNFALDGTKELVDFEDKNATLTLTRRSDLIINKHFQKVIAYLKNFGLGANMSIASIGYNKNCVYVIADAFVSKKTLEFIQEKLGMLVIIAR